jgi:hypothetical protein
MTTGPATDAICTGVQVGRVRRQRQQGDQSAGRTARTRRGTCVRGRAGRPYGQAQTGQRRGQNSDGTQGNEIG